MCGKSVSAAPGRRLFGAKTRISPKAGNILL
jgi:hypothetical protein